MCTVSSVYATRPPSIDPTLEQHMSREDRVHLANLRCVNHTSLPTYRHRIGLASDANCAFCQNIDGTPEHALLHCPALQSHRDTDHIQAALEHP